MIAGTFEFILRKRIGTRTSWLPALGYNLVRRALGHPDDASIQLPFLLSAIRTTAAVDRVYEQISIAVVLGEREGLP